MPEKKERHQTPEVEVQDAERNLEQLDGLKSIIDELPDHAKGLMHQMPDKTRNVWAGMQQIITVENHEQQQTLHMLTERLQPDRLTDLEWRAAGIRFLGNHIIDILRQGPPMETSAEIAEYLEQLNKAVRLEMDGGGVKIANDYARDHKVGDLYISRMGHAIKRASEIIKEQFNCELMATRDGGDEFSISLFSDEILSPADIEAMSDIITEEVAQSNKYTINQTTFDTYARVSAIQKAEQLHQDAFFSTHGDTRPATDDDWEAFAEEQTEIAHTITSIFDTATQQAYDNFDISAITKDPRATEGFQKIMDNRKKQLSSSTDRESIEQMYAIEDDIVRQYSDVQDILVQLDKTLQRDISQQQSKNIEALKSEDSLLAPYADTLLKEYTDSKIDLPPYQRWRTDISIGVGFGGEIFNPGVHTDTPPLASLQKDSGDNKEKLASKISLALAGAIRSIADQKGAEHKAEQKALYKSSHEQLSAGETPDDPFGAVLQVVNQRTPEAKKLAQEAEAYEQRIQQKIAENEQAFATIEQLKKELKEERSFIDTLSRAIQEEDIEHDKRYEAQQQKIQRLKQEIQQRDEEIERLRAEIGLLKTDD